MTPARKKVPQLSLSLRDEPFFEHMSDTGLDKVEEYVYHREYDTRQIIFFPEDSCEHVYWVRSGRVRITQVSSENRSFTFRHVFPGDLIGAAALIDRPRREHYAEAVEPTVLCLMRLDDFRRLTREEHEFASAVAQNLARRVADLEHVLGDTVLRPVRSRVAAGLLRLIRLDPDSDGARVRITHQEIANLVGSTRETATNVLHELRDAGVVALENRKLTILDHTALERVAGEF